MSGKKNDYNLVIDPKYKPRKVYTTKASLKGYDPSKSGGK